MPTPSLPKVASPDVKQIKIRISSETDNKEICTFRQDQVSANSAILVAMFHRDRRGQWKFEVMDKAVETHTPSPAPSFYDPWLQIYARQKSLHL